MMQNQQTESRLETEEFRRKSKIEKAKCRQRKQTEIEKEKCRQRKQTEIEKAKSRERKQTEIEKEKSRELKSSKNLDLVQEYLCLKMLSKERPYYSFFVCTSKVVHFISNSC